MSCRYRSDPEIRRSLLGARCSDTLFYDVLRSEVLVRSHARRWRLGIGGRRAHWQLTSMGCPGWNWRASSTGGPRDHHEAPVWTRLIAVNHGRRVFGLLEIEGDGRARNIRALIAATWGACPTLSLPDKGFRHKEAKLKILGWESQTTGCRHHPFALAVKGVEDTSPSRGEGICFWSSSPVCVVQGRNGVSCNLGLLCPGSAVRARADASTASRLASGVRGPWRAAFVQRRAEH